LAGSPLRFTFVIARYGAGVLGGAETAARSIAERLAASGHDVRVLATRARSYASWANELPEGTTVEHGVEVHRYTAAPRSRPWDEVLKWLSGTVPSSALLARASARAQGPIAPALLERLPVEGRERDLLVFFQLLSHLTFAGMPQVAGKSALVPLVHEERPIYTTVAGRMLTAPRALLVNTDAEAKRIARVARGRLPRVERAGVGLETPTPPSPTFVPPTPHPYVILMGRLQKSTRLLAAWRALVTSDRHPPLEVGGAPIRWRDVRLVTVGERSRAFDRLPNVVQTGVVADAERWDLLRGAVALVNPSVLESLSLVLLEAYTVSVPVIVDERCDVTADHVRLSGGGLSVDFERPADAAAAIALALRVEAVRRAMGARGAAYAERSFRWDRVVDTYERVARSTQAPEPSEVPGAAGGQDGPHGGADLS
jgi:glycosyltransferase involved in cell wall biosynthesis